jgi:hypothetical protein
VTIQQNIQRPITILGSLIIIGALIAALSGLISLENTSAIPDSFVSLYGEQVILDGNGLYARDSVSCAAQARGQDWVTLLVGIPLLGVGILLARKGNLHGRMLQAGALGYFLYTYGSYSYLSMYNSLFLLYVALFGMSLYGFVISLRLFGPEEILRALKPRFPRKFLGGYLIGMGILLALMWIARIIPSLLAGLPPVGLEHYTTLVIQASDLAVVVPAAIITGVLLLKKRALGATLAGVLFIKLLTMALALFAMMLMMARSGVTLAIAEVVIFTVLLAVGIIASVLMFFSVRSHGTTR